MAYTDEEVKALGGSRLESVHLVRVWDSSMAPLLLQGDFVLIDLERTDYHQKGVFLIRMKDQLYLRILQPRVSGGVVIKTLDPTSTTEVIEGSKMDDFEVVGRVLEKRGQAGLS